MFRMGLLSLLFCLHGNYLFKATSEEVIHLKLQIQVNSESEGLYSILHREEKWSPDQTAIIVCDVWDYHHCLNAVKRLGQFAPRLNEVIAEARRSGCIVIHAPSDCMDAYKNHPARLRAAQTPKADALPHEITQWCSQIPAEEMAVYPIDQSDGGEDDDPEEHAKWAKQLQELGRNPKMPWKRQLETIEINPECDYISDRGDEVWSILEARGIRNVILTGVHVNMCVLGRPFGLRQLARNGKNVVLMRDMTDSMYNPARWPQVSHHEGTRRILTHIERHICPTITSDQILGGSPFQWEDETKSGVEEKPILEEFRRDSDPRLGWVPIEMDSSSFDFANIQPNFGEVTWVRRVVHLSADHPPVGIRFNCHGSDFKNNDVHLWLDGEELSRTNESGTNADFAIPDSMLDGSDYYLLVAALSGKLQRGFFQFLFEEMDIPIDGNWEGRIASGDKQDHSQIMLPAKFGGSADNVFESEVPNWIPRVVTRSYAFTDGIEGPACDSDGRIYAVNYENQGTIGVVRPDGKARVLVSLPDGCTGNGIRFGRSGEMFIADYTGHNILRFSLQTGKLTVHAHEERMNQPNDLALAADGRTLYASDPDWQNGCGQIWRIDPDGTCFCVASGLGTTNGIEVSPDGRSLYVNETQQRKIWSYTIDHQGNLRDRRCIKSFADFGMDGMRCDIDGNLYVTRYGKGTVVKLTPEGQLLREFPVLGDQPSNLCFGGPDRRTLYVTEVEHQRLVSVRVDRPGRQ